MKWHVFLNSRVDPYTNPNPVIVEADLVHLELDNKLIFTKMICEEVIAVMTVNTSSWAYYKLVEEPDA